MKKILTCVGTRPNFIKITQFQKYFDKYPLIEHNLLHTGQHFDDTMSDIFFTELNLKIPDIYLNINKCSQLEGIGKIIIGMEEVINKYNPDLIIVPGDVNSSFACAFAANRLDIPVAHIESGLRSFDKHMPEEINRILIDNLSELCFVTEQSGMDNLFAENKNKNSIHFVGNTMIDTLISFLPVINKSEVVNKLESNLNHHASEPKPPLATLTFHRPSNVDNPDNLKKIVSLMINLSDVYHIVFPIHPRTKSNLLKFNLLKSIEDNNNIVLTPPLGYIDFMKLISVSNVVITDSGGIQEETTYLKIPCLTIRTTTERPVTITEGTNTLLDLNEDLIIGISRNIIKGSYKTGNIPALWDGKASERIVDIIADFLLK